MDTDAADKALEPAFAAMNADLHKQQPSACGGGCSATQMPFFLRYSSAWVYAAMATTGVSLMEKRKQWQQAVELLQQLLGTMDPCIVLLWHALHSSNLVLTGLHLLVRLTHACDLSWHCACDIHKRCRPDSGCKASLSLSLCLLVIWMPGRSKFP